MQLLQNKKSGKEIKLNLGELSKFENLLREEGFSLIAGVDEAGRGSLAGPLVAAAVILPKEINMPNLKESKQVSPKKRLKLFKEIKDAAIALSIVIIQPKDIDEFGVHKANLKALGQTFLELNPQPDFCLVDGFSPTGLDKPFLALKKGDERSISIAAASIIAKVTRDELMIEFHNEYPNYGFKHHKGYGTKEHIEKLMSFGPCKLHRTSFSPVQQALRKSEKVIV